MRYTISAPIALHAAIQLPASKSISNRALILHSLAHGNILPRNLSDCDDTMVMTRALDGNPGHIDILAAGTAMRFLTAYLSVTPGTRIITGTQRMQQRPIRILVDALRKLGAQIEYVGNEGFPPLRITGTELTGSDISLAGNVSSQYISALLMIGTVLPKGLRLHLTGDIISRPYITLTQQLMRDFGAQADWTSEDCITVSPGGYTDTPFTVESDWSAASYWYQMMAIEGIKNEKIKNKKVKKKIKEDLRMENNVNLKLYGCLRTSPLEIKIPYITPATDTISASNRIIVNSIYSDIPRFTTQSFTEGAIYYYNPSTKQFANVTTGYSLRKVSNYDIIEGESI